MNVPEDRDVVALCGSRRDGSFTRLALERALSAAEDAGARTDLVDLDDLALPVFDPDDPDAGDAEALRRRVRRADGVLLGSPMYHGSYASPLKTAIDYCGFDEFERTTVGLLAVSGGRFPSPALEHLRAVALALDAWVLPQQVAIPDVHDAFEDGRLLDEELGSRVDSLGRDLVEYAGVEAYPDATGEQALSTAD